MDLKDLVPVHDLLSRYLKRFTMAPEYTLEDVKHWFFDESKSASDQVVLGYVVEDPHTKKITDFSTFYRLESTVMGNKKHSMVKAAYLFYYASESAFENNKNEKHLKERLNALILDTTVVARKVSVKM